MNSKTRFVVFEPSNSAYRASLRLSEAFAQDCDPDLLLQRAASIYETHVSSLHARLATIARIRTRRAPVPASLVWDIGQELFSLQEQLLVLGLQVDGLYEHLTRDLGVKRKWLEKAVILRRYVPDRDLIPPNLNWGRCEKGTRRLAELIAKGEFPQLDSNQ